MYFDGDLNDAFFSIYLQSVYDTYFDEISEEDIQSLFDEIDDANQQAILLQLIQNIDTIPNLLNQ